LGVVAIQLSTQAPRLYPFFVDICGQIEPAPGSRQLTISGVWRGGVEHDVAWLASRLGITERA
jgi:hypothetical protein